MGSLNRRMEALERQEWTRSAHKSLERWFSVVDTLSDRQLASVVFIYERFQQTWSEDAHCYGRGIVTGGATWIFRQMGRMA